MEASMGCLKSTGGTAGRPKAAPGPFSMSRSGASQTRQSVARPADLTTSRRISGTSTVGCDTRRGAEFAFVQADCRVGWGQVR